MAEGEGAWKAPGEGTRGLTVFEISFDDRVSEVVYAGAWGNNLLISRDGGESWAPAHGGLETLSVRALVPAPPDPSIWSVGTVEGVYWSRDGGRSWARLGLADVTVFCLLAGPDRGHLYAGTTDGVYRSEDGGASWEAWMDRMPPATIRCLALSPDGGLLYAGVEAGGAYARPLGGGPWISLGLGGLSAFDLLAGERALYAATDGGVYRLAR